MQITPQLNRLEAKQITRLLNKPCNLTNQIEAEADDLITNSACPVKTTSPEDSLRVRMGAKSKITSLTIIMAVCLQSATSIEIDAINKTNGEQSANDSWTTMRDQPKSMRVKPVNFTRVDELWNQALEDDEVLARWKHMDQEIQYGIQSIIKSVFPEIVTMSFDAKVSEACSGAVLNWVMSLRQMRIWAVKMLDAIGKPNAGILEGSLTMFGNYHQCLSIRAPDEDEIELKDEFVEYFRGQYCVLQLKPYLPKKPQFYSLNSTIRMLARPNVKYYEKTAYDDLAELAVAFNFVNIRADLCVPSLCTRDDIQRVADYLAKKVDMRARVQRCDTEPMQSSTLIDEHHMAWTSIVVVVVLLVVLSTATNMAFRMGQRTKTKAHSLITSMSIYRSLSHMKNIHMDRINDSKPIFLYALRLLLILWIALVSLTSQLNFQYLRELLSLRDVIMKLPMQLIVNSTLQFDALILLTAFTYSYQNINSNMRDLIKYNVEKYSRLMPSIMLFVALTIITPLFYQNKSPVWHDFIDEPSQVCKSTGFINLSFLQNLLNYDQICLPQTWIFCVELQLCVLALPIVYLMNKNFDIHHGRFKLLSLPTLTLIVVALIGCIVNFSIIYNNSLPAAWFQTFPDKDDKSLYFSIYTTKTWTHLTTFAVGLFSGHLCRCKSIETFSGRPYGRRCCDNLIWFSSLATMMLIIYSTHSWSLSGVSHLEWPVMSALYGSLAPLFWAISWSLILFHLTVPNDKNQQSSIARFFVDDINIVRLGRLAFLAYLINPYVNTFVYAAQEQAIFSSVLMLGHTFIGNLVITFGLAFIISIMIEIPCRRLTRKLLRMQCKSRQLDTREKDKVPMNGVSGFP